PFVTKKEILPAYFEGIKDRLKKLQQSERRTNLPDPASLKQRPHILGGGTDLYVQKHDEMTGASIRFFFDQPQMNGIKKEGNKCIIGPSVTVTDLEESPVVIEW